MNWRLRPCTDSEGIHETEVIFDSTRMTPPDIAGCAATALPAGYARAHFGVLRRRMVMAMGGRGPGDVEISLSSRRQRGGSLR